MSSSISIESKSLRPIPWVLSPIHERGENVKYFPTRSNDDPKPFILVYTFLASALMLAVSSLPFPDFVWLMIFIPALVGMTFLLLWLLTTAFGSMDFSPYFIGGFILLSVLLDLTAWRIAYDPSTNTDEEIIITGGFQEGGP